MLDRRTLAKRAFALGAGLGLSTAARPLAHLARAQDTATPEGDAESPPTLELINGQWFDGNGFVPVTMYTEGGVFREQAPAKIDQTIDLEGNFVIPPLGDAHVHWLASPGTEEFFFLGHRRRSPRRRVLRPRPGGHPGLLPHPRSAGQHPD